jgi:hypothetical protein
MSSHLAWPRWALPKPLQAGFSHQMLPAVQRQVVEAGPPRQWQQFDSDYRILTITLARLSKAQDAAFWQFYHLHTQQGTLPFDVQFQDGRPADWWQAMFMPGETPQSSWASGYRVTVQCRLLLIGEPFTTRDAPAPAATFDSVFQLRATATAQFALAATFDAQFQLRATPVDATVALAATFDARFELRATGALNPGGALEATFDARFEMRTFVSPSEPRLTEAGEARVTESGEARVTG